MATRTSSRRVLTLVPARDTSYRSETWRIAGSSPLAAETAFDEAYARGQERRDHRQSAWAAAGQVVLIDACYRDYRSFHLWFDRLVRATVEVAGPPDADWELIVGAARAMAAAHGLDGGGPALPDTAKMLRLLRQASDPDCALYAASAMISVLDATRRDAEATHVEVAAQHLEGDAGAWSRGNWYSIRGQHALFYQRLHEAAELLALAADTARGDANRPLAKMTAIMRVRLAIAQGEHAAVPQLLSQCEPIDDEHEPMWRAVVSQLQSLALLRARRYHDALHEAHRALAFADRAAAPADEAAQMHVLEAYCVLAIGDGASAASKFRHAAVKTSGQQARVINLLAQLADADTELERGDRESGGRVLANAVAELRSLEYGAFYWPLPAVAARLCAHALTLGIEPEYVRSIVRQRGLSPPGNAPAMWPWAVKIRALGRFDIEVGGAPLRRTGKAQAKPLEMLACVVAFGGNAVASDRITRVLWRGEGREGAKSAFAVTLHRLRHLLGGAHGLTVASGRVTLDPDQVWIDHRALRTLLDTMDSSPSRDGFVAGLETLLALYTGPLLVDDPSDWASASRQQLRMRVDATLTRCVAALPTAQRQAVLARALAADPDLPIAAGMLAASSQRWTD